MKRKKEEMGIEFSLLGGFSLFVCWHVAAVGTFCRFLLNGIWATENFRFLDFCCTYHALWNMTQYWEFLECLPVLWLKCGQKWSFTSYYNWSWFIYAECASCKPVHDNFEIWSVFCYLALTLDFGVKFYQFSLSLASRD